jgi:hypothetical protein
MLSVTDSLSSTALVADLGGVVNDVEGPETTINSVKVNSKQRKATAKFSADDNSGGPVEFTCSLDSKPFKPCTSPKTYKRLQPGRHKIRVRGTDPSDNESTETKRFRIKKPD